jgi:hypothetical protein
MLKLSSSFGQTTQTKSILIIEIFMVDPYSSHGYYSQNQKTLEETVRESLSSHFKETEEDHYMTMLSKGKKFMKLKQFAGYKGEKCESQPSTSRTRMSILIKYTFSDTTTFLLGIEDYFTQVVVDGSNNLRYKCDPELLSTIKQIVTKRFDKRARKKKPIQQTCAC